MKRFVLVLALLLAAGCGGVEPEEVFAMPDSRRATCGVLWLVELHCRVDVFGPCVDIDEDDQWFNACYASCVAKSGCAGHSSCEGACLDRRSALYKD